MTGYAGSEPACVFCDIVAGDAQASVVFADELVVAFMDRYPVTRGHLLVIPRRHAAGLEEVDAPSNARVWRVGQDLARAARRAPWGCEGINLLLCDGAAAFQTVLHPHLHVIPRYPGDGYRDLEATAPERDRDLLEADAEVIRDTLRACSR